MPFLADADSDIGDAEAEERNATYARNQGTALPRYSTHGRDVQLDAGDVVEDLHVTFRDHKYQTPLNGTRTRAETDTIAQFFDPPSFATGVDMSTPIRPASRAKATQALRDPSVPVTYGGHVYASTVGSGSPLRQEFDDTALLELQDESFNNTISSVPSPPPRIAALSSRFIEPAQVHRTSVESVSSAIGSLQTRTTTAPAVVSEMENLEQQAEALERAFLLNSGGRGKQELRIMRKKAESFWEFGLTLRTFRHWLESYEHERVSYELVRLRHHTDPFRGCVGGSSTAGQRDRPSQNGQDILPMV